MTHLSDFSFLQRMVSLSYLFVWYLYRVWTLDRFKCLSPSRFRQGELKSIVTLLVLFMLPFQLYYDVTSCKIKYEEGFVSVFGHIFTKPESMWTKADQDLVIPTDYSLCIGFSLQTGTLLLLQCFWNYLANSVAKASFMSSKEFLFYIAWTFISFITFPVLQYNFSRDIYDPTWKEIMPELAYGIELFFVACLGVVSHFRFQKLLSNSRESSNARSITHKIRYFQELNLLLAIVLFLDGLAFIILSADGLTGRKTLNVHKFSADFLICNINMCSVITWFLVILIFHPKPNNAQADATMNQPSHDFLSNGKHLETYPNSPPLMMQNSQASSEYLQYTKSVAVPINQPSFTDPPAFQLGPLPPPPDVTHHNNSFGSTTPSTATLVSSPNMLRRNRSKGSISERVESVILEDGTHPKSMPMHNGYVDQYPRSDSESGIAGLSDHHNQGHHDMPPPDMMGLQNEAMAYHPMQGHHHNGQNWQISLDFGNDDRHGSQHNDRYQPPEDSSWLHQQPRGGNINGTRSS